MNENERGQAIKEAHNIAASEAYFEARAGAVNPQPHTVFDAGFSRGWDAGRAAIEAHEARRAVPDKSGTDYAKFHAKWKKGRQELANLNRAHEALKKLISSAPPAPQATNDAEKLATAIADAATKAGITDASKHSFSGPQLLLLLDDLVGMAKQASMVQEPFGYVSLHTNGQYAFSKTVAGVYHDTAKELHTVYTHPAPVREPLTPDALLKLHTDECFGGICDYSDFEQIAREVEAAHVITKEPK